MNVKKIITVLALILIFVALIWSIVAIDKDIKELEKEKVSKPIIFVSPIKNSSEKKVFICYKSNSTVYIQLEEIYSQFTKITAQNISQETKGLWTCMHFTGNIPSVFITKTNVKLKNDPWKVARRDIAKKTNGTTIVR